MSKDKLTQHANKHSSFLVGKKVDYVRYLSDEEMEMFGWYKRPLVIGFDDDTIVILQSDDEGNDGGAGYFYNFKTDVQHIIYTL